MEQCSYCHAKPQPGTKLKCCSGCKFMRYCNRECQKAAWREGHKEECVASRAYVQRVVEEMGGKQECKRLYKNIAAYIDSHRFPLTYLIHKLLLGKLETHLAFIMLEHHQGHEPEFKLSHIDIISMQQIRDGFPDTAPDLDKALGNVRQLEQRRGFALPVAHTISMVDTKTTSFPTGQPLTLGNTLESSQKLLAHLASPAALSEKRVMELLCAGQREELNDALNAALACDGLIFVPADPPAP